MLHELSGKADECSEHIRCHRNGNIGYLLSGLDWTNLLAWHDVASPSGRVVISLVYSILVRYWEWAGSAKHLRPTLYLMSP